MTIEIRRCKREQYQEAWGLIYGRDKEAIKANPRMKYVNPFLFQPLKTEKDNYCVVAYVDNEPAGVFGFIEQQSGRVIAKQFAVSPAYQGLGLGQALLIEGEKQVREMCPNAKDYYIVAAEPSANILMKYWGVQPYAGPKVTPEGFKNLYKFMVPLYRDNWDTLYKSITERINSH